MYRHWKLLVVISEADKFSFNNDLSSSACFLPAAVVWIVPSSEQKPSRDMFLRGDGRRLLIQKLGIFFKLKIVIFICVSMCVCTRACLCIHVHLCIATSWFRIRTPDPHELSDMGTGVKTWVLFKSCKCSCRLSCLSSLQNSYLASTICRSAKAMHSLCHWKSTLMREHQTLLNTKKKRHLSFSSSVNF